jgi:hypothetical protein
VALSETYVAHAFNQALGYVAQSRARLIAQGRPNDPINAANMASKLYQNNKQVPGASYSSYAAVARRAIAAEALAREMGDNPQYAPQRAALPQVPTLSTSDARYRYYVVISYEGANGAHGNTRAEVVSETPLSAEQIREHVEDRIDTSESRGRASKSALARTGAGREVVSVSIIAATRTY